MEKSFRVVLHKQQLSFSAAHFITFGDNICERLHGHNYAVRCEVSGGLNDHGYVVDFIALRDQLAAIVASLDHRVLLPTEHDRIKLTQDEHEVTVRFEDRRWVFPKDDCRLLAIANTTAELLASCIAEQLTNKNAGWSAHGIDKIVVGVDENQGQWGECELTRNGWIGSSRAD